MVRLPKGPGHNLLMQFSNLGNSKMQISKTDLFYILTIQNDQISDVKDVLAPLYVLFTLFGYFGGHSLLCGTYCSLWFLVLVDDAMRRHNAAASNPFPWASSNKSALIAHVVCTRCIPVPFGFSVLSCTAVFHRKDCDMHCTNRPVPSQEAHCALCPHCARAVRKVGCFPPR